MNCVSIFLLEISSSSGHEYLSLYLVSNTYYAMSLEYCIMADNNCVQKRWQRPLTRTQDHSEGVPLTKPVIN